MTLTPTLESIPAGEGSQGCIGVWTFMPLWRKDGSVRAWTVLDCEDYERFGEQRHHVLTGRGKQYANRKKVIAGRERAILLHRQIVGLDLDDPREVDHINGDGLDNRRCNLRIVTRGEQLQNVRSRGGVSRFRGVALSGAAHRTKPWVAYAKVNGKRSTIGYFDTEAEAAEAASAFRREHMPFTNEDRSEHQGD